MSRYGRDGREVLNWEAEKRGGDRRPFRYGVGGRRDGKGGVERVRGKRRNSTRAGPVRGTSDRGVRRRWTYVPTPPRTPSSPRTRRPGTRSGGLSGTTTDVPEGWSTKGRPSPRRPSSPTVFAGLVPASVGCRGVMGSRPVPSLGVRRHPFSIAPSVLRNFSDSG